MKVLDKAKLFQQSKNKKTKILVMSILLQKKCLILTNKRNEFELMELNAQGENRKLKDIQLLFWGFIHNNRRYMQPQLRVGIGIFEINNI
jgi:hypothetical protein